MALHIRVSTHDDGGSEETVQITKNTPDHSNVVQNTKYYFVVLFDKYCDVLRFFFIRFIPFSEKMPIIMPGHEPSKNKDKSFEN